MSELRSADRNGDEHRRDRRDEARQNLTAPGSADENGTAVAQELPRSNPDRAAHDQARALWRGLLNPAEAGVLSEVELSRAWTVAQCWRGVDPEADRAAAQAERELWHLRPDVMQRYDCLTAVGADNIEATLRVAASLDRPAPTGNSSARGVAPQPFTVHDLQAPLPSFTSAASLPTAMPAVVGVPHAGRQV
jgi:hypothetical protein